MAQHKVREGGRGEWAERGHHRRDARRVLRRRHRRRRHGRRRRQPVLHRRVQGGVRRRAQALLPVAAGTCAKMGREVGRKTLSSCEQPAQVTCKVLALRSNSWSDGPSLPSNLAAPSSGSSPSQFGLRPGFTRGTAYHREGKVRKEGRKDALFVEGLSSYLHPSFRFTSAAAPVSE